jgi:hypothetical protein
VNILVVDDTNLDRAIRIAKTLRNAGALVYVLHKGGYYNADQQLTNERAIPVLVFVHERDKRAFEQSQELGLCCVSFSGGGAEIPREVLGGFTEDEARHVVAQVVMGDNSDLKKRILAYWGDNPDRSALRLLCEAWLANRGEPSAEHDGITVHAPITADQWFAALNRKQEGQRHAWEIAARMGEARPEADCLLQAILNDEDYSIPIQNLLNKLSAREQ